MDRTGGSQVTANQIKRVIDAMDADLMNPIAYYAAHSDFLTAATRATWECAYQLAIANERREDQANGR